MPLFAVVALDHENSSKKREEYFDAHVTRLGELQRAGRLHSVGPFRDSHSSNAGFVGSLMIIDFANQEAAEQWYAEEPFNIGGVYKSVIITPFQDAQQLITDYPNISS